MLLYGYFLAYTYFYSRPCGRGDKIAVVFILHIRCISTHAPAGGATDCAYVSFAKPTGFLLTPLREGRPPRRNGPLQPHNFYSRPCGRGDGGRDAAHSRKSSISTHAPAGGATGIPASRHSLSEIFLLTPLREGRLTMTVFPYLRQSFLLTPLREGRPQRREKA